MLARKKEEPVRCYLGGMSLLKANALPKIPKFLLRKLTKERIDELVDAAVAEQKADGVSFTPEQIAEARSKMHRMLDEAQGKK